MSSVQVFEGSGVKPEQVLALEAEEQVLVQHLTTTSIDEGRIFLTDITPAMRNRLESVEKGEKVIVSFPNGFEGLDIGDGGDYRITITFRHVETRNNKIIGTLHWVRTERIV